MPADPCRIGCTCGKHQRSLEFRDEMSKRRVAEEEALGLRGLLPRHTHTEESRKSYSRAQRGRKAYRGAGSYNFNGGDEGALYASILCPVGYIRHHYVHWGSGTNDRYELDFAHLDSKTNIELDGPSHNPVHDDGVRDAKLRLLGWKIVRIEH